MEPIVGARYYHFKDRTKEYEVLGRALHTETGEHLVVYRPLYAGAATSLFVRPLTMFLEVVSKPAYGYHGPRFIVVAIAPEEGAETILPG